MRYATTSVELYQEEISDGRDGYQLRSVRVDDAGLQPVTPPGSGWAMCGSAATTTTLFWFWKAREEV